MSNPFDQFDAPGSNPFDSFDEPQVTSPEKSVRMDAAIGRKLPPLWEANVQLGDQTVPVRGVLTEENGSRAYVVGRPDGQAFYINRNPDGSLGLKPYKGKMSAAGTTGENFLAGAGKAAVDTKRGIQQLGALAGNTLGLVDDETVDRSFADAQAVKAQDADLMDTGAGIAGNIAGNIATIAGGGSLIKGAGHSVAKLGATNAGNAIRSAGAAIQAPKSYKQAAAVGAAAGGIQPAGSLEDKAVQVGGGALAGVGGQGIAKGVERVAKGASDVIGSEVKNLAKLAKDKWGISVRADQVVNSKPLNALSTAVDYVPGSGAGKARENLQKQFNQALAKTLGQTSDNPSYAIREAEKALGAEFDRVLQGTPVKADDALQTELATVMENARNEMTDQQFGVMQRQLDNILAKVGEGDVIDAQAAYNIKKGLDRIGNSTDSTLANYASEMKSALMGALNRSLGPDDAAKFATTRSQYSNLINLRKIVPRGAEADISPARLANMRGYLSQDLNELADIAATFLKPREGNSGTTPRLLGAAALGGGVPMAALNPATAIPMLAGAGLTMGTARAANKAMNSPGVARYLMEGSATAAKAVGPARAAPVTLPAFLESYLTANQK